MYVVWCGVTVCGGENVHGAVVLLVVELEADLSADRLPLPRGDLVHHVHQNRVEDRQAQRLRNTQRNTYFVKADDINMYVCRSEWQCVCMGLLRAT